MKIIAIHGDHTTKSYSRLQKLIEIAKTRDWDINRLSDNKLSVSEQLVGKTLFEKETLYVLDDIRKLKPSDVKWIGKKEKQIEGTFIVFHKGNIHKRLIDSMSKSVVIEHFKLPKKIFYLMDTLYPGNKENIIKLLKEVQETEPNEFIFALIAKHIRDLYWVKADPNTLNLPSWRLNKLRTQADKFSKDKLKSLLSMLSIIDVRSKTSKDDLGSLLDLLILTQLE